MPPRLATRLAVVVGLGLALILVARTQHSIEEWTRGMYFTFMTEEGLVQQAHAACDRCTVAPKWCSEFGSRNIDLTVAYEGSGDRLRRVIAKSLEGKPLNFGIIGGSLSRGHGCHCTTFHRQIFDWWNATFPHPDNQYVDGSVGARGSNYFKFCHVEHLRKNVDLVIIELGINDNRNEENMKNMESILRAVLSYPSKPAVVLTASFSLMGRIDMGADGHLPVAQYYDVPVINIRHALFPIIQQHPDTLKDYFVFKHPDPKRHDYLHLSSLGHYTLAQSTIAFLERQKCLVQHRRPSIAANATLFPVGEQYDTDVPRLSLLSNSWSADAVGRIDQPTCSTIDSVDAPLTPLPSSHGWEKWQQPHTEKFFWRATEVGAQIDFSVDVGEGHIQVYYLRSKKMQLGRVSCWLDDDEKHSRTMDGWWDDPTSVGAFTTVNEGRILKAGHYNLHCKTIGPGAGSEEGRGNQFMIIAILTI